MLGVRLKKSRQCNPVEQQVVSPLDRMRFSKSKMSGTRHSFKSSLLCFQLSYSLLEMVFMVNLLFKSYLSLVCTRLNTALTTLTRVVIWVGLAGCLVACQTTQPQAEPVLPVVEVVPAPVVLTTQQKTVNRILAAADYCLSRNQLLNPIADNAHDRYRSVLLMDPGNERAQLGLQTIALRYVDMAQTAARRGDLSEANIMLRYAKAIDNNAVVQDAANSMRKQLVNIPVAKAYVASEGEIVLDAKMLQSKDPQLTTQLNGVAHKAKQTDQFVLIIARNDTDGRWIYQQLRTAVPGYLVRGDIRIGSPARVKLVSTLD